MTARILFPFFLIHLMIAPSLGAQEQGSRSAWDALIQQNPGAANGMPVSEKEILQVLTTVQLREYLAGGDPNAITLESGESLAAFIAARAASGFVLAWYTIDGGGIFSSDAGGQYQLHGTIGQPEAGTATSTVPYYTLTGGFWPGVPVQMPIFGDGFESGDTSAWSSVVGL